MKLKIKKLHENAIIPSYAKEGDAGMDLSCVSVTEEELYTQYGIGIAIQIPEGYVGLVYPRSSISKTNHLMANSVGVIDSGYRGEILVRMRGKAEYLVGDRVAQLVITPVITADVEEVNELDESTRGTGGFGSTGK